MNYICNKRKKLKQIRWQSQVLILRLKLTLIKGSLSQMHSKKKSTLDTEAKFVLKK